MLSDGMIAFASFTIHFAQVNGNRILNFNSFINQLNNLVVAA